MLQDIDIMPILNESISNQKQFISFIIKQLNKRISDPKTRSMSNAMTDKIFSFLIKNADILGIPFFSLLTKKEEFSKLIFEFYYEKMYINEIISLIKKIIDIFNFNENELSNPIKDYFKNLIEYGIIEKKDLKEKEKRDSLNEEEILFLQIESLLLLWKKHRNLGNNIENDTIKFLNNNLDYCLRALDLLKYGNHSKSCIEFYEEKIEKIKNFKNKNENNNNIEEKKENIINNEINQNNINEENNINENNKEDKNVNINNDNNENINNNNNENINSNNTNIENINEPNNNIKEDIQNINIKEENNKKEIDNEDNNNNNERIKMEVKDDEESDGDLGEKEMSQDEIKNDLIELRKKPLKERIYFYKDEQIIDSEDEKTEFKNYYFPLGPNKREKLKRQICSFINSNGGRLYIGIADNRIIKGVVTIEKITFYEKIIDELVKDFYPKIEPKKFLKFYAIPVLNKNNGKIIDNLFVFKIIIKRGDPSYLYSCSTKRLNSSIRLQGQCANLTAEEIYKEIIERKKLKNKNNNNEIDDDFDMNDPSPIISQIIVDNEEKKKLINKDNKNIDNNNNKKDNNNIKYYNKDYNNKENFNIKNNENIQKGINNQDYHNQKNIDNKDKIAPNLKDGDDNNFILDEPKNKKNNINNNNEIEGLRNDNTLKRNKKNKKNKKKNKNNTFKVEVSNIDKNVDEVTLNELFKGFNCENIQFYKQQNGIKGYLDFTNEEDANNCINTFNDMTLVSNKPMKLKMVNFNI